MLAGDPHQGGLGVRGPPDQANGVVRGVEGRADVVAHPAVDGDVPADRVADQHVLDRAHRVERGRGRADHGAAGLDRDRRHRDAGVGCGGRDDLGEVSARSTRSMAARRRRCRRCRSRPRGSVQGQDRRRAAARAGRRAFAPPLRIRRTRRSASRCGSAAPRNSSSGCVRISATTAGASAIGMPNF